MCINANFYILPKQSNAQINNSQRSLQTFQPWPRNLLKKKIFSLQFRTHSHSTVGSRAEQLDIKTLEEVCLLTSTTYGSALDQD